jgi:tripartite ATP-independent transporter DctP family solute receptor
MDVTASRLTGLLAVMLLSSACAGQSPDRADDEGGGGSDAVTLRLGHVYDPNQPTHRCGGVTLAEELAAGDSGLAVDVFPSSQLGNEEEMLQQVADGSLDMSIAGPAFLGAWYKPVEALDGFYVFEDPDHQAEVLQGEIGQRLWEELHAETGLHVLGSWYYGTRHITANKPVRTPADLAGVKLRVPAAELYNVNARALGASATPMALGDVYLGLQQGVIDAQENPIPTIEANGFHEVQDYLNLTGHHVASTQVVTSEATMERLTDEQQEALESAVQKVAENVRECVDTADEEILAEWRESGAIEIVDDVDVDSFQQRTGEVLSEEFADTWGDLYQEIQAAAGQ